MATVSVTNRLKYIHVFAALPFFIGSALAAPKTMRQSCGADIKAQCAGIQPKGGALMNCFAEHRETISDACKVALADQMLDRRAKKMARASRRPHVGARGSRARAEIARIGPYHHGRRRRAHRRERRRAGRRRS